MRYGYARVSSGDQNLDRQRAMLDEARCSSIVEEIESGVRARHRLNQLLARLGPGDELVVAELDRLGRSTGEAVLLMDDLTRRGVVLRVLALPSLDITTNDGRLVADILASLAAHERRRTRERQRGGIDAAKQAGRHLGRPPKLTGEQLAEAERMLSENRPVGEVARLFRVHPKTLRQSLQRAAAVLNS